MVSVLRFEEISNNAWPALQTMLYDGWVLRFADGVTKRSNSVSLLYASGIDPAKKIDFCEQLYMAKGIRPCFKITGISEPGGIDKLLETRGYFIHSYISFQTIDLTGFPTNDPTGPIAQEHDLANVRMDTELNPGWMDDFIRMNEFDPARKSTYLAIMNQLNLPKCLTTITINKKTVGVGLGVAEGDFVGIFDIVVDKSVRNNGLGRLIVETILRWSKTMGAETAYLQVLADNYPAISLYQKMGFREIYQYWYRMKQ
jgi:ribosomal protein S18 acetylase RimI-like enzyme